MVKLNNECLCKNCKYYKVQKVTKDAVLFSCKKDSDNFDLDNKSIKSCFNKRKILKKN